MLWIWSVRMGLVGGTVRRPYHAIAIFNGLLINNGSLKFEITAKRLYAASQRVL